MENKLELLCDIKNILGEGPFYNNGNISFVDILDKKIHIFNGNIKTIIFNEKIGAAIPLQGIDGFLICAETAIFIYKNGIIKEYIKLDNIIDEGMRCNDAKIDSLNRLWFSTMVDDGISEAHGGLYCIKNNKIICMDKDVKLGNGLAFSKDNKKLFYVDSILHKIYEYDYDLENGNISNKKVLFEINNGTPDGMCIDEDDNLFIAIWGGGRIEVRSTKTKELLDIINIPTKLITSCTFSGDNLNELIITTATLDEKDIYAGKVFKIKTKYKGRKERFYRL